MRVLVIDHEAKQKAVRIMGYARSHVYYPDLDPDPPDSNPHHVCYLNSYRCVFAYTQSPQSGLLYRHLLVSIPSPSYPSPDAVAAIATLFEFSGADQGYETQLEASKWVMHVRADEPHAIELVEELR